MNHYYKYYSRLYDGQKVPRKAKKTILGRRSSKNKLNKRMEQTRIIYDIQTIFDGFGLSDVFCPYCGCEEHTRSGNRAEYPDIWETLYCMRCGEKIAEADNSPYIHVLYDMKYDAWKESQAALQSTNEVQ